MIVCDCFMAAFPVPNGHRECPYCGLVWTGDGSIHGRPGTSIPFSQRLIAARDEIRELRDQAVVRGKELDKLRGHACSLEAMHQQTASDYRTVYAMWVSLRFPPVMPPPIVDRDPGDEG